MALYLEKDQQFAWGSEFQKGYNLWVTVKWLEALSGISWDVATLKVVLHKPVFWSVGVLSPLCVSVNMGAISHNHLLLCYMNCKNKHKICVILTMFPETSVEFGTNLHFQNQHYNRTECNRHLENWEKVSYVFK